MSSLASLASARSCRDGVVGIARDREKALDDAKRIARQRSALQGRLLEETVGDFGNRATTDIGGAGNRHQVGDQRQRRLAVGAGQGGEHALIFIAARRGGERQPLDIRRQVDLAVEILDQPPAPDRIEAERIDQRVEQRHVAGADFDVFQAERRGGLKRQRQHFRIRRGAVLPAEGLDAGLQKLARPPPAIAEHRAEIAEARQAGRRGWRRDSRARPEW